MKELFKNYLVKGGEDYKNKSFSKDKPGEAFEYSNIAAALAAYVLEQATGENFKDFTQKEIFNPLNMTNTGWSFRDIDFTKHTNLYANTRKQLANYFLVTYPEGGLLTTSEDMAKYCTELIKGYNGDGIILNPESYREFFTRNLDENHFEEKEGSGNYNIGIFVRITELDYIGHGGDDPGVKTRFYFNPKTGIGRYIQANTEINEKGWKNLDAIWNKLEEYETLFK